jgi:3'-phosphoadenosine 5'-phosphosulfate sulfotransferase (PAPS reductase)/FAD synthetase
MDPFKIDEPTVISFSGGRTSAYMLWRVLQSNNGLPDQAKAVFCNTGKEDEATLRFVHDCSVNWGIPIIWLEYRVAEVPFEVVNFETASRNGEPFSALIKKKNYLPNPVARFCTVDLKILTLERYIKSIGWAEYENMIGIRADEPRRVAKIRANPSDGRKGVSRFMPLAQVGVQKEDISKFWKSQDFDLGLPNIGGVTYHGNCDLCFLKGASQLMSLIAEKPERAVWWAAQEGTISNAHIKDGGLFRKDRPSYAQMLKYSEQQDDMFAMGDDESIACFCGD